mmetsp:Transcript_12407/g.18613  ORF Transcript_12407/g.18613 Transcript_12407/m.18613 type:complete len:96 (-) Transcript_12407:774-1061(-)
MFTFQEPIQSKNLQLIISPSIHRGLCNAERRVAGNLNGLELFFDRSSLKNITSPVKSVMSLMTISAPVLSSDLSPDMSILACESSFSGLIWLAPT